MKITLKKAQEIIRNAAAVVLNGNVIEPNLIDDGDAEFWLSLQPCQSDDEIVFSKSAKPRVEEGCLILTDATFKEEHELTILHAVTLE